MGEEPSRLVGELQVAVQLVRADALLAGADEVVREHDLVQRDMRALKHRADGHRVGLAALAALIDARTRGLALKLGGGVDRAAMRTNGAIRPAKVL